MVSKSLLQYFQYFSAPGNILNFVISWFAAFYMRDSCLLHDFKFCIQQEYLILSDRIQYFLIFCRIVLQEVLYFHFQKILHSNHESSNPFLRAHHTLMQKSRHTLCIIVFMNSFHQKDWQICTIMASYLFKIWWKQVVTICQKYVSKKLNKSSFASSEVREIAFY